MFQLGIIVHELGHALGFWHEHQRSDRDEYIEVLEKNALQSLSFFSEFKRTADTNNLVRYDYSSVMHYASKSMTNNGRTTIRTRDPIHQRSIGQRVGLSFSDAKLANLAYCSDRCSGIQLLARCQNSGYQDPNDCRRCKCPDGWSGTYCQQLAPSSSGCGGEIFLAEGAERTLSSPGYFSVHRKYEDFQECNWRIKAPPGQTINFRFDGDFGLFCQNDACFHWVEIRLSHRLGDLGGRFCCHQRPAGLYRSHTSQAMVLFRANFSSVVWARRGFLLSVFVNGVGLPNPAPNIPLPTTERPTTPTPQPTFTPRAFPSVTSNYPGSQKNAIRKRLDLAIVLDGSHNVDNDKWRFKLDLASQVISRLTVAAEYFRISLISYSDYAELHSHLNTFPESSDVQNALKSIRWQQRGSNLTGALLVALDNVFDTRQGDRLEIPNVILILLDSRSMQPSRLAVVASELRSRNIHVIVAGVGESLDMSQLEILCDAPMRENFFWAAKFPQMAQLRDPVVEKISHLAVKSSSIGTPSVCLQPGYLDLALLLESSRLVGRDGWNSMTAWVARLVGRLRSEADVVRIAALSFGRRAYLDFQLGFYRTAADLDRAIKRLPYRDEVPKPSVAFNFVPEFVFLEARGDRRRVPNVALFITTGGSADEWRDLADAARRARSLGLRVIAVGIGELITYTQLQVATGGTTAGAIFMLRSVRDLEEINDGILNELCKKSDLAVTTAALPTFSTKLPWAPTVGPPLLPTRGPMPPIEFPATLPPNTFVPTRRIPGRTPGYIPPAIPPLVPGRTPGYTPPAILPLVPGRTPGYIPPASPPRIPGRTPGYIPPAIPPRIPRPLPPPVAPTPVPGFPHISEDNCRAIDLCFVLDSSGSIGRGNWRRVLEFAKDVSSSLEIGSEASAVGAVSFGNMATRHFQLNDFKDKRAILRAIDEIEWKDQWTNTSGGLRVMRQDVFRTNFGDRPQVPDVALLVTDGESNKDKALTVPEARATQAEGVLVFVVGVGQAVDLTEMSGVASDPDRDHLFHVNSFDQLYTLRQRIRKALCMVNDGVPPKRPPPAPTSVPYVPPRIDVRGRVRTGCSQADIVFILDSSANLAPVWHALREVVTRSVAEINLSERDNHVALVTTGRGAHIHFRLTDYFFQSSIQSIMETLALDGGMDSVPAAIYRTRSTILSEAFGARASSPDIAIIITASRSSADSHLVVAESLSIRKQNVRLMVLGLGQDVSPVELSEAVSQPSLQNAFFAEDLRQLEARRQELMLRACGPLRFNDGRNNDDQLLPNVDTTTSNQWVRISGTDSAWSTWSPCSESCGGCGMRKRRKLCRQDDSLDSCGSQEAESCNPRVCTSGDTCTYFVSLIRHARSCDECCAGWYRVGHVCLRN